MEPAVVASSSPTVERVRRRWIILTLLTLATALSYLDRQSLPVVVGEVQKDIAIGNLDYARLQALFLFAYALMYLGGGWLVDRLGTRAGYALLLGWWSAANALHGAVHNYSQLAFCRFLLGLGEGGGFPASAKAVAEWFPQSLRSFAFGCFNTGSALGAVIAPPVLAWIVMVQGWRPVFLWTGGVGLLWVVCWLIFYREPARAVGLEKTPPTQAMSVRKLFGMGPVWTLALAKFFSDAAWYFFLFWLPKYLGDVRHLDIQHLGALSWIPYGAAAFGSLMAGLLSGLLINRASLNFARKAALGAAAALLPASLGITNAPLAGALFFFSLAFLGHQAFSTIMQTLTADLFPSSVVGTVAGFMGAAGSVGGIVSNSLAGWWLAGQGSYSTIFLAVGLLHPLSFLIICVGIRRIRRLELPDAG